MMPMIFLDKPLDNPGYFVFGIKGQGNGRQFYAYFEHNNKDCAKEEIRRLLSQNAGEGQFAIEALWSQKWGWEDIPF